MAVMSESAVQTMQLCIRLAGGFALFGGLIAVVEACGVTQTLTHLARAPLRALFPGIIHNEAARAAISENLIANAMGLGNAATPAGLRAMEAMRDRCREGRATDDMCMLLVLNATGVQLLPTGVIALRAAAGSAAPASILLPTILSTALSTAAGIAICLICRQRR